MGGGGGGRVGLELGFPIYLCILGWVGGGGGGRDSVFFPLPLYGTLWSWSFRSWSLYLCTCTPFSLCVC